MITILTVTEAHIRNGVPGNSQCCPIALAFLERFQVFEVLVDHESITYYVRIVEGVHESWALYRYVELPETASLFIAEFDAGRPVSPIEFEINVQDEEEEE